ncbi:hypothetical protein M1N52_00810 [Thermodesulfovibrionales bacterium]|nr:hypothetical protein [Thermodesulfovibrionales bacterium]MCL0085810.1 hypothetical protein [Thermodesulfovibrionales bacterium]
MYYLSTFIADAYVASLALQGGTYPGLDEIIWALLPFILIFVVFLFPSYKATAAEGKAT